MRAHEFMLENSSTLPNENSLGRPIANSEESLRNFWNWFQGSKAVDKEGRPLVVYHGSKSDFEEFEPRGGGDYGYGIYFTTHQSTANEFAKDWQNADNPVGMVYSTYLNIKNPFVVGSHNSMWDRFLDASDREEMTLHEYLMKKGYDGINATSPRYYDSPDEQYFIVFKPNQAKSSIGNKGTYSGDRMVDEEVTQSELSNVEAFADRLWGKFGIDVSFTRHFFDRLNDPRNGKPISTAELVRLFKKEYERWGKTISDLDGEGVMKDSGTDVNLPFAKQGDKMAAKTIMRKQDFKTPDPEYVVEKKKGVDGKACWDGYRYAGTEDGKDKCVKMGEDWSKTNKKDKTDGMSKKAVAAYRRENPGSKLKTAVTKDPKKIKKGSKDDSRRKSFCSRSNGQRKMHNIDCSKTPDKPICKARRRWNCEE